MATPLPILMVPGLLCSARLYAPQVSALWGYGPVMVTDHRHDDDIRAVAGRILDSAPPRFALVGLSYGGYIAFEVVRQAANRVQKLALLDTSARPDTPEQSNMRHAQIAMVQEGRFDQIPALSIPRYLHASRQNDESMTSIVHAMAAETGPDAFIRQLKAIMSRPDSRPDLAQIRCLTLVLVGDGDVATPPDLGKEIATGIPGARLAVVANCGHLSTIEQPQAVNAALIDWLSR